MRMPAGVKPGAVVEITFLDHVEDGNDAIEFKVWGRIRYVTKRTVTVETWAYADKNGEGDDGSVNVKAFTIVKKAMTDLRFLIHRKDS